MFNPLCQNVLLSLWTSAAAFNFFSKHEMVIFRYVFQAFTVHLFYFADCEPISCSNIPIGDDKPYSVFSISSSNSTKTGSCVSLLQVRQQSRFRKC